MTENGSQNILINGRYRVLKKLGEGGMGAVFKVADTQHNDKVLALKKMKRMGGDNEETYHKLFKKEFEVLAGLEHPHIARAFDYGPIADGSGYFFTSEFVKGIDLLQGTRGVGLENLLEVMVQSCRALDYVHSRGLIHHDLKPDNILLTEPEGVQSGGEAGGEAGWLSSEIDALESYLGEIMIEKRIVKIIDFGLIMGEREDSKRISGTPQYMPPEKIKKERCGRRGDLYSLGVVFYQIFTRRLPFISPSMRDLFSRIIGAEPEPVSTYLPEIPEAVENIILKLMAKDPKDRFNRAAEVIVELNEQLGRDYSLETEVSAEGYITSGKCVGRDKQLSMVMSSAEPVFEKRDCSSSGEQYYNMFCVSGEEGIGKTRFIRELKMEFQLRDVLLIDIEFERFRSNIPLFVREVLSSLEEDPSFQNSVSGTELEQARLFKDEEPGSEVPEEVIEFLAGSILALSRLRPVSLVTGSLGDAPGPLIPFIVHLAGILAQSRISCGEGKTTAGNEYAFIGICEMPADLRKYAEMRRVKEEFADPEKFRNILLESLTREQTGLLISSMFGQGYIPGGFIDKLYNATNGNPRYMFEVIKDLTSNMQISRKGSSWQFDKNIESINPPPAYRRTLTGRVREVDSDTARILNVLGVIQEEIPLNYIRDFTGYDLDELMFKLSVLEKRSIIRSSGSGDSECYRVAFDFLYDVVRDTMDEQEKKHLTGKLGTLFENELTVGNREELCVPLAELFITSEDAERGVRYGLRAGENLISRNRFEETRDLYERLLPLFRAEDYIEFIKVASKLAETYEVNGEYRKAIGLYEQILKRGDVVLKGWNKALIFRKIAHLLVFLARYTEAESMLEQGREYIITGEESLESALFCSSEGLIESRLGHFARSLELTQRADSMIREFGDGSPRVRKEELNNKLIKGGVLFFTGRFTESAEILEQVIQDAREMNFSAAEGTGLNILGSIHMEKGEFDRGNELFTQALGIFRDRSDNISLQEVNLNIARSLLYNNKYMECLERIEKILLDSVAKEGYENIAGKAYGQFGHLNRFFGRHSAACRCFEKELSFFQKTGNIYLACSAIADSAEHFIDVNMFEEAGPLIKRASRTASECGYADIEARVLKIEAGMYCRKNDISSARERFMKCEQKLSSMEYEYSAWLWRSQWIYENALYNPEHMDTSVIPRIEQSPVADIPIVSCYIDYASGIKALQQDDRETSWSLFSKAENTSQRYHFMEVFIHTNLQMNVLHVMKTGDVSNRFLNAARRSLERIEEHLNEDERGQYLTSSAIKNSSLLIVAEGKDELTADRNIGEIWGQQTALGQDPDIGSAQTYISDDGSASADPDSSDFIKQGIQDDLDDSTGLDHDDSGRLETINAPDGDNVPEYESGYTDTIAEDDISFDDPVSPEPEAVNMEKRSVPPPPPSEYLQKKPPKKKEKKKPVPGVDMGVAVPTGEDLPPVSVSGPAPPSGIPGADTAPPPEQERRMPPPPEPEQSVPQSEQERRMPPPLPQEEQRSVQKPVQEDAPQSEKKRTGPPPLPDMGFLPADMQKPEPQIEGAEEDGQSKKDSYDWDSMFPKGNKEDGEKT